MDEYKLLSKSESNVCNLRECISLNTFSWENLTDVYGMQFTHYQLIVHWVPSSKVHIQSQVNVQDIVQHSAFLPIVVITKFFVFINMLRMVGGKDILYYARLIAFMTYFFCVFLNIQIYYIIHILETDRNRVWTFAYTRVHGHRTITARALY